MACSVCGDHGHQKHICLADMLDKAGVSDEVKAQAIEHLTNEISDEMLAELVEAAADCVIPGLGLTVKLCRYACRVERS